MHHSSLTLAAHRPTRMPGWSRAGLWVRLAFRIIAKAPSHMILLPFLPVLAEMLLQMLPGVGMLLSKLTVPALTAWTLLMVDNKARLGAARPVSSLMHLGGRPSALVGLAILGVLVFAIQCLTAWLLLDVGAALILATGQIDAVGLDRTQLGWVLASGALPSFFLFFVAPRVALAGRSVPIALLDNLARLCAWWRPVMVFMAVMAAALAVVPWQPGLLLILIPLGCMIGYSGYRDAFDSGMERVDGT